MADIEAAKSLVDAPPPTSRPTTPGGAEPPPFIPNAKPLEVIGRLLSVPLIVIFSPLTLLMMIAHIIPYRCGHPEGKKAKWRFILDLITSFIWFGEFIFMPWKFHILWGVAKRNKWLINHDELFKEFRGQRAFILDVLTMPFYWLVFFTYYRFPRLDFLMRGWDSFINRAVTKKQNIDHGSILQHEHLAVASKTFDWLNEFFPETKAVRGAGNEGAEMPRRQPRLIFYEGFNVLYDMLHLLVPVQRLMLFIFGADKTSTTFQRVVYGGMYLLVGIIPIAGVVLYFFLDYDSFTTAVTGILIVWFATAIILIFAGLVQVVRDPTRTSIRDPSAKVSWKKWQNYVAVLVILMEFPQLTSFAFNESVPWHRDTEPLRIAFRVTVFNFGDNTFKISLGISAGLAFLWSLLLMLPRIVEYRLAWLRIGRLDAVKLIIVLLQILSGPAYFQILLTNLKVFDCYQPDDSHKLRVEPDLVCWRDLQHLQYALVAIVVLFVYFPTATLSTPDSFESTNVADIKYLAVFMIIEHTIKAMLSAAFVLLTTKYTTAYLAFSAVILYILSGIAYKFKPCCIENVNKIRLTSFLSGAWAATCALIADVMDTLGYPGISNWIPFGILVAGWVIMAIVLVYRLTHKEVVALEDLKVRLADSGVSGHTMVQDICRRLEDPTQVVDALKVIDGFADDPSQGPKFIQAGVLAKILKLADRDLKDMAYDQELEKRMPEFEETSLSIVRKFFNLPTGANVVASMYTWHYFEKMRTARGDKFSAAELYNRLIVIGGMGMGFKSEDPEIRRNALALLRDAVHSLDLQIAAFLISSALDGFSAGDVIHSLVGRGNFKVALAALMTTYAAAERESEKGLKMRRKVVTSLVYMCMMQAGAPPRVFRYLTQPGRGAEIFGQMKSETDPVIKHWVFLLEAYAAEQAPFDGMVRSSIPFLGEDKFDHHAAMPADHPYYDTLKEVHPLSITSPDKRQKMLVLGPHGSGKTIYARQLGNEFSYGMTKATTEWISHTDAHIRQRPVASTEPLMREAPGVGHELTEEETILQKWAAENHYNTQLAEPEHYQAIHKLWQTVWAREAFFRSGELEDGDWYMFENTLRLADTANEITLLDFMNYHARTSGIVQVEHDDKPYLWNVKAHTLDIGGARSERRKWKHAFPDVNGLIFLAPLTEYMRESFEDNTRNRLDETMRMFTEVAETAWFTKVPIVLFMCKADLLQIVARRCPLSSKFPEYAGGPENFPAMIDYIVNVYASNHKNTRRFLKVFVGSVLNPDDCRQVTAMLMDMMAVTQECENLDAVAEDHLENRRRYVEEDERPDAGVFHALFPLMSAVA